MCLQTTESEPAVSHSSLRIIRDEHTSLAAMLRSLVMMLDRGPGEHAQAYFDVLRAMLFYIDEVPERQHHPKETQLLFPHIARKCPELVDVIARLDHDHVKSEVGIRELQHLLLAWELLGETRREAFMTAARRYIDAYLDHMRTEEHEILPRAEQVLTNEDWAEVDAAFERNQDPLNNKQPRDPVYDRLFSRIVMSAPEPIGLGPA